MPQMYAQPGTLQHPTRPMGMGMQQPYAMAPVQMQTMGMAPQAHPGMHPEQATMAPLQPMDSPFSPQEMRMMSTPQSQSLQQPMSQQSIPPQQQPLSQQPLSQQPLSNAPQTPATPQQTHSVQPQHQTPMSVPSVQTGSVQPEMQPGQSMPDRSASQISQQFPLANTDPLGVARMMILKDLRHAICVCCFYLFRVLTEF